MNDSFFAARYGDSWENFDVGVCSTKRLDISFVIAGITIDQYMFLFEHNLIPARNDIVKFMGVFYA